jgi:glycosyltransferase involved in cell wall biosynthesis
VVHLVPALFGAQNGGIVGGAERYAFELARHMAAEVPTVLVTFAEKSSQEELGPLKVRVLGRPWYVRGNRANPFTPALLSALQNTDVVHCHQQHVIASSIAALFCRLTRRRVFVTELGGGGWDVSSYVSTDRWFDHHLHISEYSRTVAGHAGKPWAHVISGGVDTRKFSPDDSIKRDGTVLFVGRILPHKGLDYLVEALPNDMRLELIGPALDASYLQRLKSLAERKNVVFRHDCNDGKLVDAYRRSLCVVLPSVYRTSGGAMTQVPELLGQTLLEAMACATPAICTNVASMPEIVEDGLTGFVVPPNDSESLHNALCRLRDNSELARSMGAAGRRRVLEKFTWPSVVRRCLAIYSASLT